MAEAQPPQGGSSDNTETLAGNGALPGAESTLPESGASPNGEARNGEVAARGQDQALARQETTEEGSQQAAAEQAPGAEVNGKEEKPHEKGEEPQKPNGDAEERALPVEVDPGEVEAEDLEDAESPPSETLVTTPKIAHWSTISRERKLLFLGICVFVAIYVTACFLWLFPPNYRLLYSNLVMDDCVEIVTRLEALSIPYRLGISNKAVYVKEKDIDRLRCQFLIHALPRGGNVGIVEDTAMKELRSLIIMSSALFVSILLFVLVVKPVMHWVNEGERQARLAERLALEGGLAELPEGVAGELTGAGSTVEGALPLGEEESMDTNGKKPVEAAEKDSVNYRKEIKRMVDSRRQDIISMIKAMITEKTPA